MNQITGFTGILISLEMKGIVSGWKDLILNVPNKTHKMQ